MSVISCQVFNTKCTSHYYNYDKITAKLHCNITIVHYVLMLCHIVFMYNCI